jgi:AraC-like DNA-binding protein
VKTNRGRRPEVSYREAPPPVNLKPYIDKLWEFSCPEGCPLSEFDLNADYTSSILIYLLPPKVPEIYVSGPNSHSQPLGITGYSSVIGIRFLPAILPLLLKCKAAKMVNIFAKLSDFIGNQKYNSLQRSLAKTSNNSQMISAIGDILFPKIKAADLPDKSILNAVNMIIHEEGNIKVEQVYGAQKLSTRQFQRNFAAFTGLAAKEFCRLVRLRCSMNRLVKEGFNHFDVLVKAGYYDQSHYYREFKEFLGMLPSRFEKRQRIIHHRKLIDN